ncbi:GntR family transcriptional regulator [Streptomyces sp. NPDC054949]|uniref:GntR family transcriptional regulator n=1 Tax=unclassified Streptomyces TaxID=2593676 RepID=UPI0006AF95FC|nr:MULTISPECIES: GntR family transcriptional regulator [unclassified Streptomyces]KOU67763.1 GntR family transcriptional regulator [Streptomyces sp. WM4235]MCX5074551.1 GntR family transcriptional regulator [Streptomyces sp. NBC_00424]WUD42272.1 GntR family transcriptional regulator [Streptomyces sp. NBC_00513]
MPSAATAVTAADRVYRHVKQGVLDRRFEGGLLLTEGEVAEAVGVSRTPVREALLRLETEGLLKLYPKKGALVLPVSVQEIADVIETRLLVEEFTARKAVPAPPALLDRLAALIEEQRRHAAEGDLVALMAADRGFHAEIVRHAGNQILCRLYDQLRDRQLRMGVALLHAHPERVERTLVEHTEILDALRSGDADTTAAAVRAHVGRVEALVRGDAR